MERDVGLTGPSNFRDLGGYRTADGRQVRWRRVFRSDALRLSAGDVAVLREEIGLRTVVDLRTGFEYGHREGGGNPTHVARLTEVGARRHHLPMIDETRVARAASDIRPPAAKGYLKMLERGAGALAGLFDLLAEDEHHPLVFHCAAGKDRTGVAAALLLGVLGVDDETIVADYALSQANMARALERIRARPDADRILADRPPAAFEAPTDAVIGMVLAVHETYGSWEGAAITVGIDPSTIGAVRELLLTV
jgi:protein-tyrosine phosphatase